MATAETDLPATGHSGSPPFDVVDGIEVPRKLGTTANSLTLRIAKLMSAFVEANALGIVTRNRIVRLKIGGVPIRCDVLFADRDRFDPRAAADEPCWDLVPNLAVEVVEWITKWHWLEKKLEDYFAAGVESVWVVSNRRHRVTVYSSMKNLVAYEGDDVIDAAPVLPGLKIPLADVYAKMGM
jgi:Uma2 family endonuclease